ncbi:hypothetical protein MPSEU_000630400 [Mayamaea pseudoterrestris]|nr:hypothetical protein MPSEU_000630400 [Mayamaea pseudoterrestris]
MLRQPDPDGSHGRDRDRPNHSRQTSASPLPDFALELLKSMSLEEKIGQLSQIEINMLVNVDEKKNKLVINETAVDYYIGVKGIGSVLNTFSKPTTALEYRQIAMRLQQVAAKYRRPPVIWGLDSVHGANYVHGAILAPQPINIGATFNVTTAYQAGLLASRDTRAAGINWLFSPLLGIALEPRWSRVFEIFGEDPILARILGNAMIRGIQEPSTSSSSTNSTPSRAAACAKHFIGYSMPRDGHDRSPSWIPTRHLYQYFVPAWKHLEALTVMESYNDYDGVPNVQNHQSLDYLLRQRLKFDGVVVTDYSEMFNLASFHKTVDSDQNAVLSSYRQASVDMSMIPWDYDVFADAIVHGVKKHLLSEERVDQSVLRVLRLKQDLNMFDEILEEDDPNIDLVGTDERSVLDMVRQSIVLTKNEENILPLSTDNSTRLRILVTGPTANSLIYQSGAWTGQWQGAPNEQEWFTYGSTVLDGLSHEASWDVSYSCGTDILGGNCQDEDEDESAAGVIEQVEEWAGIGSSQDSVARAIDEAQGVDVIVVCVGEEASTEKPGDIRSLRLPQGQYELVQQLRESVSMAKIVLVYFGGRPRLIGDMVELSDAVMVAFLPGPSAGQAIADIITNRVNPSGRLPITYPMYEDGGGIPYFHAVSDLCTMGEGTLPHWEYVPCEVQWPFGHGLSYTTFAYSGLKVSGGIDKDLEVSLSVKNTGSLAGAHTVLVFTFDEYRITTPETKRLRAFEKVYLEPGQSTTIKFTIALDDLKFIGPNDETHYIIDNNMESWVGIGEQVDCRADQEQSLCALIKSDRAGQAYVAACEAACKIWEESGCADDYHLTAKSCQSSCTAISTYPTDSMDLVNNGWGWKYVNCLESVVWGFERGGGSNCPLMTSMCRNIFDETSFLLDENGLGSAHTLSFRLDTLPTVNLVALSVGLAATLIIAFFIRGGVREPANRRTDREEDNAHDDAHSIQLT